MAFSEDQLKQLRSKLNPKYICSREVDGKSLVYIEGWHAIAEANRIFGFDAWDRETVSEKCVWTARVGNQFGCAYTVKVRISVRTKDQVIYREGSGSGEARSDKPGEAHEIAIKTAETDATKRALATFGNPFGLALYDKNLAGVRGGAARIRIPGSAPAELSDWTIHTADGEKLKICANAAEFCTELEAYLKGSKDLESLFAMWSQNLEGLSRLDILKGSDTKDHSQTLIKAFKRHSRKLADSSHLNGRVDKSKLALGEPKRIRSKEHLAFVASHACLICGRKPAQAHHIRFAQPRAMACKVSDEYTVPLCAAHHDALHRVGNEQEWWDTHGIDPLPVAHQLWKNRRAMRQG